VPNPVLRAPMIKLADSEGDGGAGGREQPRGSKGERVRSAIEYSSVNPSKLDFRFHRHVEATVTSFSSLFST
jgi:hypothetical protein